MKGRWPKPADDETFDQIIEALKLAHGAVPQFSVGKLVQAAVVIQAGFWPGTLHQSPDAELLKGLTALVPIEDEADWNIEENEEVLA